MIKILFIIGTGSFFGGVSRFLASRYIQNTLVSSFPFGTFIVNIIGCFLIGLFFGLSDRENGMNAEWRMFLTVGFCGGFTTFSSFSLQTLTLARDAEWLYAGLNILGSVALCLIGVWLGHVAAATLNR